MLCNPSLPDKQKRMDLMNDVYNYWITKKNIMNRFKDNDTGYQAESSAKNLKWLVEQRLEKPYEADSPLSDGDFRRIKVEIDAFDKALGGNFANFAWIVPEGISKQDPTARRFYLNLNKVLDFERVQINKVLTANSYIADHMLDAYISMHGGRKAGGDKAIKKLRSLRREMAEADPSEHVQAEFISKIENFVQNDPQGETVKQFTELVHMDTDTFQRVKKPGYRNEDGQLVDYNSNVYEAVKKARENLNDLGKTYMLGLNDLKKIISLKYVNSQDVSLGKTNKKAKRMIDNIDEAIKDIDKGIDRGGYFPHVQFENLIDIKEKLSKAMISNSQNKDYAFGDMVDNIISNIDASTIPAHARKTNPLIKQYWEKDPLMVLKEYGDQAVQFNKMTRTQIEYLDALKHLHKSDTKFQKGMRRFIDEEFTVFTQGTGGRADWVNKAVTNLNALQTARTMGLNITGAVKNAASAIHFYSRVGIGALNATRKAMDHDPAFRTAIQKAETEAGFLFTDAAKELYTEGLITRKDFESGKVQFDPVSGTIRIEGSKLREAGDKAKSWSLDKLLFFHRLTENNQRKWMYRTAFHKKYSKLINDGYQQDKALMFSKNYALKMVNSWAYEYAAHAKSKAVRGEWRTIDEIESGSISRKMAGVGGGLSEVAFHLLHYPMSLFETHYDAMKGVHKSLLAKQGLESEEIQYAMRYAIISGGVALASVLTNTDFTNIIENESVDRIKRVVDDLTEFDNPNQGTFGLMGEFTGPTLGTLKHLMVASEIIDIDNNDLNKILFGNVDFSDPNDAMAERFNAYQFSTFWGTMKNKIWPALESGRGRDLLTHYLKFYPAEWTKKGHGFIYGDKPKKKSKKKRMTNNERALAVLESMRR